MFRVISYILAVAIFTTPWFIGGNWPFCRFWLLLFGAAGLSVIFINQLLAKSGKPALDDPKIALHNVWLLLAAGCIFTAFQASGASGWLQARLGAENPAISIHQTIFESSANHLGKHPQRIDTENALGNETGDRLKNHLPQKRPISVYPAATREKLVDLILAAGIFFIATIVLNRAKYLLPILMALASSGVAVSFVGILQRLSYNGKVLWVYELVGGGAPFGPFVNGNNAAGFLLISFSAAIFFVVYKLNLWNLEHAPEHMTLAEGNWESNAKQGIGSRILEAVAKIESRHLYFLASLTMIVVGICSSLSRGGIVALACAGMLSCFLITKTNRLVGIALTLTILAGGLALVTYTDQSTSIAQEIDSLNDLSTAAGPRVQHWIDAIPFAKNNWLLGCGHGTYRVVSPSFDSFFSTKTFAHAESVYIETLIEMGIIGLFLLIAVLGCCIAASVKLMRCKDPFNPALGIAGVVCLVGQALAAALDFGIYQPANSIAMAALMGGIVGRAATIPSKASASEPTATQQQDTNKSSIQTFAPLALLLLASLASGWASYESYGIESRRSGTRAVRLFNELQIRGQKPSSSNTLNLAEVQLKTAAKIRPDDANAYFYLGELSMMRYRHLQTQQIASELETQIEELEKLKAFTEDESTTEILARREQIKEQQTLLQNIDHAQTWNSTAPLALHQTFRRAERIDRNHAQKSRSDANVQAHLQPAWNYYAIAEELCPRTPKTQIRLAEFDIFRPSPAPNDQNSIRLTESDRIKLVLERANANTQLLFDCGFLALNSGNQPEAVRLWSKCLTFPHRLSLERVIVELCQAELPMRLFFEQVLPQDPYNLTYYMRKYFNPNQRSVPMQLLANHTTTVVMQQTEPKSLEQFWLLAEVSLLNQEYQTAAKHYAEVDKLGPDKVADTFRYHFSLSLFHSQQYDEAMRNVKICELNHYEPRKTKKLIKQIQQARRNQLRFRQSTTN